MCDPGVPKLAERITNESGRAHETEPESLKKADKKIQNKRQYQNEYSQSANERPTKVLARERQRQRERERERERERDGGTGQDDSRSSVPVYGNNGFPRSRAQRDSFE